MSDENDYLKDLVNETVHDKSLKDNPNLIFEQYKLYVEMANDISNRRDNTNKFYLTLISALFGIVMGILKIYGNDLFLIFPLIFCIFISYLWISHINEYKKLNEGKFKIINYIENYLPLKCFTIEWKLIKPEYSEITSKEKLIPIIFIIFFIVFLMINFNAMKI